MAMAMARGGEELELELARDRVRGMRSAEPLLPVRADANAGAVWWLHGHEGWFRH